MRSVVVLRSRLVKHAIDLVSDLQRCEANCQFPRTSPDELSFATHLLTSGISFDLYISSEGSSLLRDFPERRSELFLSSVNNLVFRRMSAFVVVISILLSSECTSFDTVSGLFLAVGAVLDSVGCDGSFHVRSGRRWRWERERSVSSFGDANDMKDELSIRRYTGEDRAVRVRLCQR